MSLLENKMLPGVLFILHLLLAVFLFPLYMQPEPPEVALCLGVIPCFVLVYATIAWRPSTYMQEDYLLPFESDLCEDNHSVGSCSQDLALGFGDINFYIGKEHRLVVHWMISFPGYGKGCEVLKDGMTRGTGYFVLVVPH
ncbi:unnamed protein product [Sphenostylis stenocarpa]|uniref:Uncharacterized protein n=1 Tax=Sphenostylis stenocarpa TaxID=92480 RepID=A0AA86SGU8_9FABA|nr:unnamed protein product [Sphenostylis stenocarpa]